MKQNKKPINEQVGINAHTAEAEKISGEGILPTSLKKFRDVESLCKAYNSLEAEFTKRCQKIKELEGEIENIRKSSLKSENDIAPTKDEFFHKSDNDADNGLIDACLSENYANKQATFGTTEKDSSFDEKDEIRNKADDRGEFVDKNTARKSKEVILSENSEDENLKAVSEGMKEGTITEFFRAYPDAVPYAVEIGRNLKGDVGKTNLLDAYVKVLRGKITRADAIIPPEYGVSGKVCEIPEIPESVKENIIREYLFSLKEKTPRLIGGGGEIPLTPPLRPKTISEVGRLAQNIIKFR